MDKQDELARMLRVLREANRLQAVKNSGMVDSAGDETFDEISTRAGLIFKAPVAQFTTIEVERQFMNSSIGFDVSEAPTVDSFCIFTIQSSEIITYTLDASKDPRFLENPYVISTPFVRFYAGCPIYYQNEKVGTICVYDFVPRSEIAQIQVEALQQCADDAAKLIVERNHHQ